MVEFCAIWLNDLPLMGGVSKDYNPSNFLTGTVLDFDKHYKIPFQEYVEVHE